MGRPDDQEASRLLSGRGPSSVSDFQDEPPTPISEEPDDLLDFSGSASANVPANGGPAPHIVTDSNVDPPPSYSEISDPITSPSLRSPAHDANTPPSLPSPPNLFKKDANTGREYYMDQRLDTDPTFLEQCVRYWVTLPPRQYMRVKGQHREAVHRDNKTKTEWVTDFEVKVDVTPYLYRDPERLISMAAPRTVEQHEKTRRGTVCRRYGSGYKKCGSGHGTNTGAHGRIELGAEEESAGSAAAKKPTLTEWCHLYCASHASLKTFSIRKKVVGLDTEKLKMRLETLVRDTNYRGDIVVDFPTAGDQVEVYSACKTNEWRLTTWIRVLFSCLLLIIFTWPYLLLTTKRFEVVIVEWPFSRYREHESTLEYASITEEQLFNLWSRPVHQAVISKRVCTLDQQDLVDPDGRPLVQTGSQALDVLVGAGVRAMNEVNRQLGWGRHSGS